MTCSTRAFPRAHLPSGVIARSFDYSLGDGPVRTIIRAEASSIGFALGFGGPLPALPIRGTIQVDNNTPIEVTDESRVVINFVHGVRQVILNFPQAAGYFLSVSLVLGAEQLTFGGP